MGKLLLGSAKNMIQIMEERRERAAETRSWGKKALSHEIVKRP